MANLEWHRDYRDYISRLAMECLLVLSEELEEVSRDGGCKATLFRMNLYKSFRNSL